ncbi:MAG: YlxR family protein [Chloroflexi bacterium]|nr:YlxR family protein [Chloroflexota bacterium]
MTGAKGPRPRHIPQRTCIGCREAQGKRTLIRVVRTPEQRVIIDATGKANGRGAYLHANAACWEKALKGGTIKYALKITPVPEDVEALRAFANELPAEESEDV